MAKNDPKRGLDEQMLEGGGGGGGSSFAKKAGKAAEIAGITALGGYAVGLPGLAAYKSEQIQEERREAAKAKREAANEMKRESRGMAKGGSASARADGCATKGKTKGRFV